MVRVQNIVTKEVFLIDEAQVPLLGQEEKVHCYSGLKKGCHEMGVGFVCVRTQVKPRIFLGTHLALLEGSDDQD